MHIGILNFNDSAADRVTGVSRLIEAAQQKGHTASAYYEALFAFEHTKSGLEVYYEGKAFEAPQVMIARPNFVQEPMPHAATLEAFQHLHIPVLNGSPDGLIISKEKLAQHLIFTKNHLPMPAWAIARNPAHALDAAKHLTFPVVIKVPFGTHGKGIFYAENSETLSPIVEYLNVRDGNPVIIEKFISEANRSDIRVLVLQGKVIAAMERKARPGDVRANASLGGQGFPVTLSAEEIALAIRATQLVNLDLAGVDLLRSAQGPLIIEINANPGFAELEKATGIDVAKCIVEGALKMTQHQ